MCGKIVVAELTAHRQPVGEPVVPPCHPANTTTLIEIEAWSELRRWFPASSYRVALSEIPAFADAANDHPQAGDAVIGNDVWIGSEAIILPGIRTGAGAVIGPPALIACDLEP